MSESWFECLSCGNKTNTDKNKCSDCGGKTRELSIKEKLQLGKIYSQEEIYKALERFEEEDLLKNILFELDKGHIGDNNAKLTNFLTLITGLLENPKRHQTNAITGDSSTGKNNLIENNLKHFPDGSYIYISSASQSVIEDDIGEIPIIAFKEINFHREGGANKNLLEVFKQVTEGGTATIKKDTRTGFKTARHETSEQKVVIYPTTESERDEEAETRSIFIDVKKDYNKIKNVNDNTCDEFSDMDKLSSQLENKDSWIKKGLSAFWSRTEKLEIVLPYAKFLKEKINGEDIFDHHSPRSQRDIKRLFSLTCATTFLFQEQRQKVNNNSKAFLISEPQDFINTLKISEEFFNKTYNGLDARLTEILNIMGEYNQEWTPRDFIQGKIETSRNTIKNYCSTLSSAGLIDGTTGKELNEKEGMKIYDGNKAYYKRCNKGVKKPLIRCEINELKEFLEQKTKKAIDTFDFFNLSNIKEEKEEEKGVKNKGVKMVDDAVDDLVFPKIDTFSLTPFENKPSKQELIDFYKSQGYSEEQLKEMLENREAQNETL